MTDLSRILDQRMNDRIISALNELDFVEFQELMSNLLGKIGLKVTDRRTEGDAVQFRGESEEGRYLVLASRLFDHASLNSIKRLRTTARAEGRNPVLMITNDLDAETKKYAEAEGISFADKQKLLLLLRKYELADPIVGEMDQRILESQGNRTLPSASRFDSHMAKAIEHMDMGHYEEALYDLDRALELKPNHDAVWRLRASAQYQLGHLEEATESCQRGIELRPTDNNAWLLLGLIRGQAGDPEGELRSYENVLRLDPSNRSALLNKGTALYKLKKLDQALKCFDQLIRVDGNDAMAWNNRGIVLKALNRRRDALDAFTRAAMLDRDYVNPLINLGIMHTEDGQPEKAAQDWKMVLQLQRRRPEIWLSLGQALREQGEMEDARLAFESALQYDPGMEEAQRQIEEIDALLHPLEEAPAVVAPEVTKAPVEVPCPVPELEPEPAEAPGPVVEEGTDEGPTIPLSYEEAKVAETRVEDKQEPPTAETSPEKFECHALVCEPDMALELPPLVHQELTLVEGREICESPKEKALLALEPETSIFQTTHPQAEAKTATEPGVLAPIEEEKVLMEEDRVCQPTTDLEPAPAEDTCETGPEVIETAMMVAVLDATTTPQASMVEEADVLAPLPLVIEPEGELEIPFMGRLSVQMLLLVGEGEKALTVVDRALLEEPESSELMHLRAQALIALGRHDEALTALGASYHVSKQGDLLYDIEALSQRFGRKVEAQRLLTMLPPSQESFARELAGHLDRKEYDQISRSARTGERTSVTSRQCLALAYMMERRYRDAAKIWQDILTHFPGWAEALNNLGVCMRFIGEYGYEEPLRYLMLATLVEPDYADAWNNIGCVYFATAAYGEALKAFNVAIDLDRNPEYYLNLSSVQMALGEVAAAKQSLTSALQLEETPEVMYMLAVIAEKEGELRWAANLYEDAVALKPDFRDALFNLQRVKLQLKYGRDK